MNNELACPLCDRKPGTWQELAEHLVRMHNGLRLTEGGCALKVNKKRTVQCWCRAWFALGYTPMSLWASPPDADMGRWAEHLKRRGGAAAHILELTLGVQRK